MTADQARPGFIGLGLMGTPIARRILKANSALHVWNRSTSKTHPFAQAGAKIANTPATLVQNCDVVALCVTDTDAVESVLFGKDGIVEGAGANTVVVDHSTVFPEKARAMAERLKKISGAKLIDAPVTGGVRGAEQGTLIAFAGGEEEEIEQARAVVGAYTKRFDRVGASGAGQVMKLCNQVIVMNSMSVYAEAVLLAERGGIDVSALADTLRDGLADSNLMKFLVPKMATRNNTVTATLRTVLKDLDLICRQGTASGTPVPVSETTAGLVRKLVDRGDGDLDFSQFIRLHEDE